MDDKMIEEAKRLGRHKTKRAAVNAVLEEYVNRRKRKKILSLFGKMEWDNKYDYKKERSNR